MQTKLTQFFKKNTGVDLGHFRPCFEQQTQNHVFFFCARGAQCVCMSKSGQKWSKSIQNHFFVKFG